MIRPLQDRVLVQRVEAEDKTASGIIIPDTAKEKPSEGKVVAVGPGKRLDNGSIQEMGVKKGDKILFSKYNDEPFPMTRASSFHEISTKATALG